MEKKFLGLWPMARRGMALVATARLLVSLDTPAAVSSGADQVRTNAFYLVDLSSFGLPLSVDGLATRQFGPAPKGLQSFHGVPFQLGERLAVTGMGPARNGELYPAEVIGIRVGRRAKRLHLLHGALSADKDGTPLAKLIFHYEDGAQESLRLGYGIHARNWIKPRLEKKSGLLDPNSQLAWSEGDGNERGAEFRLFQSAIENPRPAEAITTIDLVSLFSRATPVIFAISVEEGDSGLPPNRPVKAKKIFRELLEFGDSVYRQEFVLAVTDAQDGRPLTNALTGFTLTDDDQTYYLGEARADATGVCRLAFPPQQTVAFGLLVRSPDHVPLVISVSRTNHAGFHREFKASLERGMAVGGVIKNPDGKPIGGVEVLIHRVAKTGSREYLRTDYDTAVTEGNGKWSSRSLPLDLKGFSFQLTHPDYKPALYTMPGSAPPPTNSAAIAPSRASSYQRLDDGSLIANPPPQATRNSRPSTPRPSISLVTSNALVTATAEMTLQPAIPMKGIVAGNDGKPISQAEVIFQRNSPAYERKHLLTDAQGRFRLMVAEPGDAALFVIRKGQTPKFVSLDIEPGMGAVEIALEPARTLRGQVVDRRRSPVPGAKIRLDEWQGTADLLHFQTLTDKQGRFAWAGAPTDQVMLYLSKSNYYNMRQSFSGFSDEMTLSLNRWPGASGKVYDAETRKPIDSFLVLKGRKYSLGDSQIRWDRYDAVRSHKGEYTIRIDDYYFQPEAHIMVEAPGYIPQISEGWRTADSYTNDFALKRGKGISGIVQKADGTHVGNATVLIVDKNETGYMDTPGQLRTGSSNGEFARSDARGHFEFPPKLEADMILAAHEQGYAEVKADQVAASGRIVLQPWGRVKGGMRVGDQPAPDQSVRLQHRYDRFYEPGYRSSALSLYLKAEPDDSGNFVFEKVPAGDRRIYVEYRFNENNQRETPLSHGLPVAVKPGETTEVLLGGTGRSVVGRVNVVGGDPSEVDWKRDVHKLTLVVPVPSVTPPNITGLTRPEEQQKAWADFNKRQNEFWRSEAGRAVELLERTYVLLFDTNGNFHVDNVPAGKYTLQINASDPTEESYRQRTIGNLSQEVIVPNEPGASVNQPFNIGALELRIQSPLKIGKAAPPFSAKTLDGKTIQLSDFSGQAVLLYFWAASAISTSDVQILKELHTTYGKEGRLVVLGMNLDADAKVAAQFVKDNSITWPQAHLGDWGQTQVPALFGLDGYPVGVLIDGQGKLAARQLRGLSLRTTVRNTLSRAIPTKVAKP